MQTEALMLDTHEKRPLYLQLTDALLKQIVDEYQADDKLPTEMELCDEYAVSRTTVRLAMKVMAGGEHGLSAAIELAALLVDGDENARQVG